MSGRSGGLKMRRVFNRPIVVLMTATLNPGPYASGVRRSDPRVRAEDYESALQFWANLADPRIAGFVFCDNSGEDLGTFTFQSSRPVLSRPIEWLSFDGNLRPNGMHYGYSELGHLEHAITNSRLLAGTHIFLKVTGRLTFPRISKLLDTFSDDVRFAVDCRRAYKCESGPPIRARTQIILFERFFYLDNFFGQREQMLLSCTHLEEFIALKVLPFLNDPCVVPRFKVECPAVGVSAYTDTKYHGGKSLLKSKLRQVMRRIAPRVWL
jgi:hypothetical protein